MKLNLVKVAEAGAVGGIDIGLEKIDESQGLVAPASAQFVGRVGLFALGFVGSAMGLGGAKLEPHLETLMIAEEPLMIRSLVKLTGLIGEYAEAPSREAIELRLRQAGGRGVSPQLRTARFR